LIAVPARRQGEGETDDVSTERALVVLPPAVVAPNIPKNLFAFPHGAAANVG
jgi:hypothetical protein